jgi:hypothetical protein
MNHHEISTWSHHHSVQFRRISRPSQFSGEVIKVPETAWMPEKGGFKRMSEIYTYGSKVLRVLPIFGLRCTCAGLEFAGLRVQKLILFSAW